MNIIGIGIDATDIPRIEKSITRFGLRFLQRVFTEGEIAYCSARHHSAPSYAARFAAKEAAMKALGTGCAQGVVWTDIEVLRNDGPPRLEFHGGAMRQFLKLGGTASFLTLTHSDSLALAQVMLIGSQAADRSE
jgi:holo-[acyl-carrier protein] synthase